jgi:hypothetical protein
VTPLRLIVESGIAEWIEFRKGDGVTSSLAMAREIVSNLVDYGWLEVREEHPANATSPQLDMSHTKTK